MHNEVKAVVFDKDGILFPTEEMSQVDFLLAAHEISGRKFPDDSFHCILGFTRMQGDVILKRKFGDDFPLNEIRDRKTELFVARLKNQPLPVKDGVREYLELLLDKNIPAALATSATLEYTEIQLAKTGLRHYFKSITCGSSDPTLKSKPAPDIFLKAASNLGIAPEDCIAYEDSQAGVIAAFLAGMQVCHVRDLLAPSNLIKNLAMRCINSFRDLL